MSPPLVSQINSCLTPKEREVFKLLAEGKKDRDIAQLLGVSEHTIRGRVYDAVNRIGAESRCHALAILVREGKV